MIEADMYNTQVSATLLITGAEASLFIIERRSPTRNYLCHPQLQPNLRHNTTDVKTFELIVRSGFGVRWLNQPIPRTDASIDREGSGIFFCYRTWCLCSVP